MAYDYLKDPAAIYRRSFALVREAIDLCGVPEALHPVIIRLVHATAAPDIVVDLEWSDDLPGATGAALAGGAAVIADCQMVASGITRRFLAPGGEVFCALDDPRVVELANTLGTTRSAAQVELWWPRLAGAVVAIGNAPTALFHLLETLEAGAPTPAAILAFPVGFVGAAESKRALVDAGLGIPFITLHGRRGGSALAAAAVNGFIAPDPA